MIGRPGPACGAAYGGNVGEMESSGDHWVWVPGQCIKPPLAAPPSLDLETAMAPRGKARSHVLGILRLADLRYLSSVGVH